MKAVGQHSVVKVKGIIDKVSADKYIKDENGLHIIEFEARSGSYLLDCKLLNKFYFELAYENWSDEKKMCAEEFWRI